MASRRSVGIDWAGDGVEEDVPLGAEAHEQDAADVEADAGLDEGRHRPTVMKLDVSLSRFVAGLVVGFTAGLGDDLAP
jgi:hypothetical protein